MLREQCVQPRDVALPEGDGPPPDGAVGRVRETDESLAVRGLKELHERGELPLARLLAERQLLEKLCLPPGCRRLRDHEVNATREGVTEV